MTQEQTNEVVRVCGLGFDYWDIPPAWRKDISEEDWKFAEEAKAEMRMEMEAGEIVEEWPDNIEERLENL